MFVYVQSFVLANACYRLPCQNGGSCFMDSSTKGYRCDCQHGLDPATDCQTQPKGLIISTWAAYLCFLS